MKYPHHKHAEVLLKAWCLRCSCETLHEHLLDTSCAEKNTPFTEMSAAQQLKPSSKTTTKNCLAGMIGGAARSFYKVCLYQTQIENLLAAVLLYL